MIHLTLEGYKIPSWNQLYSGRHWSKRAAMAAEAKTAVRVAIGDYAGEPEDEPVHITVTSYVTHHPMDADNICSKLVIDGLIGWLITDDNPKYVLSVTTKSRVDKDNPRVVIEILSQEQEPC